MQAGTTAGRRDYDADVAARTNMQRTPSSDATVGVTYDADVAARTNMQRAARTEAPAKAARCCWPDDQLILGKWLWDGACHLRSKAGR
jgi:hypothetical protein